MNEQININTINEIQTQYKNKISTEEWVFYNKYIESLESLKIGLSKVTEQDKVRKANEILQKLTTNTEAIFIRNQIRELKELAGSYQEQKTSVSKTTNQKLVEFKNWRKSVDDKYNQEHWSSEAEKKSSETSLNLDNFEEKLRKIVLSWEVDRSQLEQKIDEILSNSEFEKYTPEDKEKVKNNILAIAEQKTLDLAKLDKMINWLYDPKNPKVVKFSNPQTWKTETIEFGSEEKAKNFLYNLKQYAKGELENVYSDEFSEWFLPATDIRKLIDQRDFSASGLVFEGVLYALPLILAWVITLRNPVWWVWESVSRRLWDFSWKWSNDESKTFSSELKNEYNKSIAWWMLDGPNKADLQKLQARSDIYDILKAKWETLTWDNQIKFFKELNEIREKFFYSRSNTYVYKMYWLLKDKGLAYDARILFTEWLRVVPDFKSINPFKWKLSPIDSTDTFYWRIWNDKTYESINKWYDLFFQWGTPDEKKLYDRANLTFDDTKFSYFENFLRAEWANDDKVKQIKTYIESLKNKRKSVTEINRVIWLMLKNWDLIHSTEPISKAIGELKLNNASKKKMALLENFRDKVENHTWLGTEDEFNKTLEQIKNWKIKKVSDNFYDETKFPKHTDFVTDGFNKVPEINKAKSEVLEKLWFKDNVDWFYKKLSDYIWYYVPNDKEKDLKIKFGDDLDKLKNSITDKEWFAKQIADIFDIKTENKNFDDLINEIKGKTDKINIGDLDVFSNRFKWIENTPQDKLDKIKENYGIDKLKGIVSEGEVERISKEIENLVNSMSKNDYLVWQISYIIDKIVDWESFNDLENIDWRKISIDNSKMESQKVKDLIDKHNQQKIESENKQTEIKNEKEEIEKFNNSELKEISEIDKKISELNKLTNEKDILEFIGDNELSKKYWVSTIISDSNFDLKTQTLNKLKFTKEVELRLDKTLELSWLNDDEIRKISDEIVEKNFYTETELNEFLSKKTNWNISKLLTEAEILDKLKLKIDSLWLTWLKADIQGNKVILKNEKGEVIKLEEWIVEIKKADDGIAKMFRKVARYF